MSIDELEKDEKILWQSNMKFYFQTITFLISSVTLVISIVIDVFIISRLIFDMFVILTISILITSFSFFGIIYTLFNWLIPKSSDTIEYFATNNKIVERCEKKEYIEYFTFEYSKIKKIKVRQSGFFKKRNVSIIVFPKYKPTSPFEWRFRFFKEQGVKLPQRLFQESYHVLLHVSDYEPLLKILEQHHVKIIYK